MATNEIQDFLKKKIFKDCKVSEDQENVECCKCDKVSPIKGNSSSSCKLNPNEVGDCIKFFTCPVSNCGHICCLERGGPKVQNKKKSGLKNI